MDGRVQAWSPLCRVRHPARTRPRATDEFPPVWWSIEDRTQHPTGRCPKEEWMPKITPCLWFDTEGERAAQHYTSVFPDSRISEVARYGPAGPRPEGTVMTVAFSLDGQEFLALNGGPEYAFTEAISFQVHCATQEEVDHYWSKLSESGEEGPCGWLKDAYGVMLLCSSSRGRKIVRAVPTGGGGVELVVDLAGEVALEAAQDLLGGLAFGEPALHVGRGRLVVAQSGDHGPMQAN